ncbi:MAG: PQQ-dependent sugar dehydrogenase [Ferruginibacter sp.]|nr:PQQ-dependent sugar dehydrogenase [Ferruginibacter sp.]
MMYKTFPSIVAVAGLLLAACNNNSPVNGITAPNTADTTIAPGVETNSPNTSYKPAFAGQTRVAAVKTQAAFEGKLISKELQKPWGLVALPDGRLLITEKDGNLRIATTAGALSAPITGLLPVDNNAQGGLLGVTIDPAFATNRMVYWTYSGIVGNANLTAVAKGKLSADEKMIENATMIYQATPAYKGNLHYGSRILFDKNGNLLVSTGERSDMETRPQAQFLNSGLGKIVRITTEGKPAAGNPFAGIDSVRPEIYSYGHRNVQGLAINPATGDLWETEFGPKGGDELNRVEAGKNYGWPTITYGLEYSGAKVGDAIQQKAGLEQPVYYWDPVISPSGISFYNSDSIPEWKGNLFISGLSSMQITRIVLKDDKVVGEERLLTGERKRFRAVTEGKDGALYAVTDDGCLYRVGKK